MAPGPKAGPALFLGLELATDQLRASIVDESLELVGVECVDFDTELPEYQYVFLWHMFCSSVSRCQRLGRSTIATCSLHIASRVISLES
jgi:xylulokinase